MPRFRMCRSHRHSSTSSTMTPAWGSTSHVSRSPPSATRGHDLALVEAEESLLIGSDLVEPDVRVAGIDELARGLEMRFGIGTARHVCGRVLLVDHRRRLFEV